MSWKGDWKIKTYTPNPTYAPDFFAVGETLEIDDTTTSKKFKNKTKKQDFSPTFNGNTVTVTYKHNNTDYTLKATKSRSGEKYMLVASIDAGSGHEAPVGSFDTNDGPAY